MLLQDGCVYCVFYTEITLGVSSACFVKIPIARGHAISIPIVSLIPAERVVYQPREAGEGFHVLLDAGSEAAALMHW